MKNRSCRGGCGHLAGKTETFEGKHSKMVLEQRNGVVGSKDPVIERGFGASRIVWRGPREGRIVPRLGRLVEERRG